jgi:CHAT domain-containing protein/tetratricopeptide (TPR) repeat protein
LVEELFHAPPGQRAGLYQAHASHALALAVALKERCYAAWGSAPAEVAQIALLLRELAYATSQSAVVAYADWVAGLADLVAGHMDHAIEQLDLAASGFLGIDDTHNAASTQVGKLMALATLGRYDEAIACGREIRLVFLAHQDVQATGKVEQNLGTLCWRRGDYLAAAEWYELARERFLQVGDTRELARVFNNLANLCALRLDIRGAVTLYTQALAYAQSSELTVTEAEIECNLGNLALAQGQYKQALQYLEQSRRRYAEIGMAHESAYAEQELAEAYLDLNLIPEAAAIYERVIPTFADLGMRREQALALASAGQASRLLNHTAHARTQFAHSRELFQQEQNEVGVALVTLFEAQLALDQDDYARSAALAHEAEQRFEAANHPGRRLVASWVAAEAQRQLGELASAQPLLQRTLAQARQLRLPQIIQRCQTSLGLLALSHGDQQIARTAFLDAVGQIEALRSPLSGEEFRASFIADKSTPYDELIRIYLDDSDQQAILALEMVERARSQALVDLLHNQVELHHQADNEQEAALLEQLAEQRHSLNWLYSQHSRALEQPEGFSGNAAELQNRIVEHEQALLVLNRQLHHAGSPPSIEAVPFDLEKLQADLGTDTVVIEYYCLGNELIAFVVSQGQIQVIRSLADTAMVAQLIQQLRFQTDALRHGSTRMQAHLAQLTRRAQHYLGRLHDTLIRPLQALLTTERIVIVPHRMLHYVPFHALYDGQQYLLEQHEICYNPSATVLQYCLQRPHTGRQRALLVGVPDHRTPRMTNEIQALTACFPESIVLLDEAATSAALHAHAPHVDLLHLACHGKFRHDNPLFSSLRLADTWLTVRDAYALQLNCDLVTLSACETGLSAVAPGDELIGLARGFFAAGAPSLLVSLWAVDDESTATLMTDVYMRMQAGQRPAAALRAAQQALLQQQAHPFFWSPFALLGRW